MKKRPFIVEETIAAVCGIVILYMAFRVFA